eukprot:TRINITY_DN8860_c0_g1_i1.p1 TRINITY_DN8860_c0_g1~~TRINITY_DN8860_c0_g1_i1.p1  ORF type:complete len:278 (+),score=40.58 TRINITY_DN8860_c0_g1_i1:31-834(+)
MATQDAVQGTLLITDDEIAAGCGEQQEEDEDEDDATLLEMNPRIKYRPGDTSGHQWLNKRHQKDLSNKLAADPTTTPLTVVSLGGGPGSDWLAIHLLQAYHNYAHFTLHVYDLPFWGDVWDTSPENAFNLQQYFDTNSDVHFHGVDITKGKLPGLPTGEIQLCVFFYFVSEMWRLAGSFKPVFRDLVEKALPGAVFFFLESKSPQLKQFMKQLFVENSDLMELHAKGQFELLLPSVVRYQFHRFTTNFGLTPRHGGPGRLYIWQKKR